MPLTIEKMSERLTGANCTPEKKELIAKQLTYLHEANPVIFKRVHDKIAYYNINKPIAVKDLQVLNTEISKQVLIATNLKMVGKASESLHALATITNSAELQKICKLSTMLIDFTSNANILKQMFGKKPKLDFKDLFASSFDLVSVGMKVLGAFMGSSGPSFEEVMVEQLQAVSKQIHELHKAMLEEFGQVHEHLQLLHNTLYECTLDIKLLIENKINGFRSDATHRLNEIQSNLIDLKDDVRTGQIQSLLQKLKDLCVDVEHCLQDNSIATDASRVQQLANDLECKWIKLHAAAPVLSAANYTASTHKLDTYFLKQNINQLHNILGYIAKIGKDNKLGVRDIKLEAIVNVDVVKMAINNYLKLRRKFPNYISDDEDGEKLSTIIDYLSNTLKVVRNIQKGTNLFSSLFADYITAVNDVKSVTEMQVNAANTHYRQVYNCQLIDLNHDVEKMKVAFKLQLPKNPTATPEQTSSNPLPNFNLQTYKGYANFDLPREIIIAELLGIDSLRVKCTYGGFWRSDFLVYSDPSPDVASLLNICFDFAGHENPQVIHQAIDSEHPYINSVYIFIKFYVKFSYGNTAHWSGYDVYLNDPELASNQKVKALLQEVYGIGRRLITDPELLFTLVTRPLKVITFSEENKYGYDKTILNSLPGKINSWIMVARKEQVANELLKNNSAQFVRALEHLDFAKQRLITFSLVAGLPSEIHLQILALKGAENVIQDLQNYESFATIDDTYWQPPKVEEVVALKNTCVMLLSNKHAVFNSKVEKSILEAMAPVNVFSSLYVHYKSNPGQIFLSAEEKATQLGLNPTSLSSSPYIVGVPYYCALIIAIIESNIVNIGRSCKKENGNATGIDVTKVLTERLVCAIHLAAYIGNASVIEELLKNDLDNSCINETTASGDTPLMFAVRSGSVEAVKLLCKLGANIKKLNDDNKSAAQIATDLGFHNMLIFLEPRSAATPKMRMR